MKKYNLKNNRGFTILFASLIGSLVMAIGMAILAVTVMQINLSSAGRESQRAFYSADTGTECALFLNYGGGNPAAGSDACPDGVFPKPGGQAGVCTAGSETGNFQYKCQGQAVTNFTVDTQESKVVTSFSIDNKSFDDANVNQDSCFLVKISKTTDSTSIESRGYSTCANNTNKFERAIYTTNI